MLNLLTCSKAEQAFASRHKYFKHISNDFYINTDLTKIDFIDAADDEFHAKPDFQLASGIFLEFKDHKLNYQRTKKKADDRLLKEQANWFNRHKTDHYLQLMYGWNHSLEKQLIVQQTLKQQNKRMVVVFSKAATKGDLFDVFIKKAEKKGLDLCIEGDDKFNALRMLSNPATLH